MVWSSIAFIFYILILLGSLIVVPLGFPGSWLMVLVSIIYSFVGDFQSGKNDLWVIAVMGVLAGLGEVLEFGIGIMASKKMNVPNGAVISSLVGGLLGVLVGVPVPLIGSMIGLFVGTFLGAFIYELIERRDVALALQSALGAFFSRATALFVKTIIAFVMVVYLLVKTF